VVDLKISLRPSLIGVPGQMVPKTYQGSRYQLNSTPPSGGVFRALGTVAFEKITPSMVGINTKPQLLVFCFHLKRPIMGISAIRFGYCKTARF
jgi:hypothetical protein